MIKNEVMGILFTNVHDEYLGELTAKRAVASIPFGARYRLIDFALSNLVNAGVSKVGVITKSNYQSLMDHIGSGKYWDLDRKKGGLFILPPYNTTESGFSESKIDALGGIMTFLRRSSEKYVVMCDANVVGNIDIDAVIEYHKEKQADVTFVYKSGAGSDNDHDKISFKVLKSGAIKDIRVDDSDSKTSNYSLHILVLEREKLIELIKEAQSKNLKHLTKDVFMAKEGELKYFGFKANTYATVINSREAYVKANFDLLDPKVRAELFCPERPIYTKNRDNMPAKYGIEAKVTNSLVGDGAVIHATVKNSIVFRDVTVEEGANIENCILMQGCTVKANATLKHVAADKNSVVSEGSEISGNKNYTVIIPKETTV